MKKFSVCCALVAVVFFSASSLRADETDCCAGSVSAAKSCCTASFAKLDLSASQKAKMEELAAACDKTGCSPEGMATMERSAKVVLTQKQFAAWKSACAKSSEKSQG